jgi:hypothetical protein
VTLLIVRTVLRGGRALAMAAAVALVDLLYAAVGLAGIGRALSGTTRPYLHPKREDLIAGLREVEAVWASSAFASV